MKKSALLLPIFLPGVLILNAQPTITDANLPAIGMETIYKSYDADNFNPGASGANVSWDFSGLSQGSTVTYSYVDPTAVTGHSNFPGSNICAVGDGDYRVFMDRQSTGLNHVGSIYSANSYVKYSNHQELLNLPITYQDNFNEVLDGIVDWGSFTVDRKGTTTMTADAYGTLILPNETLTNVLRVKAVDVMNDSLNGNWQGLYEYTTYTWYHDSRVDGVLTWRISKVVSASSTSIDTTGEFFNQLITNVDEVMNQSREVKVYPNPCRLEFNIEYRGDLAESVDIYDLTGKLVKHQRLSQGSGFRKELIDVRHLEGVYNVVIRGKGKVISRRLVVRGSIY